jgi:hypothetical protein
LGPPARRLRTAASLIAIPYHNTVWLAGSTSAFDHVHRRNEPPIDVTVRMDGLVRNGFAPAGGRRADLKMLGLRGRPPRLDVTKAGRAVPKLL